MLQTTILTILQTIYKQFYTIYSNFNPITNSTQINLTIQ